MTNYAGKRHVAGSSVGRFLRRGWVVYSLAGHHKPVKD